MSVQTVSDNKVVSLLYTLRDEEGQVLDASTREEPLTYLHGAENIVPGLEDALTGSKVGAKLKVTVAPEDGYGEHSGLEPQAIPLEVFGDEAIEEGASIIAEDDDGNQTVLWVIEVGEESVLVDSNHPLAGETLHFEVEVLEIRDATAEEIEHGHPHDGEFH